MCNGNEPIKKPIWLWKTKDYLTKTLPVKQFDWIWNMANLGRFQIDLGIDPPIKQIITLIPLEANNCLQ